MFRKKLLTRFSLTLYVCLFVLCGCSAQSKQMITLEHEISEIKRQIIQLQRSDQERLVLLNKLLQKLEGMLKTVTRSNAEMSSEVNTLLAEIRSLQGEMGNNAHKINLLLSRLNSVSGTSGRKQVSPQPPPSSTQTTYTYQDKPPESQPDSGFSEVQYDEDKLYRLAYGKYLHGDYALAINGFKSFLENFPNSPLADNARYWTGESNYSQKQFRRALDEFYQLIKSYPSGDKVPAAMLKIGLCYVELQRPGLAKETFEKLIQQFPTSIESIHANEKLKLLQ